MINKMAQTLIDYHYYVQSNKRSSGTNTDMVLRLNPPLVKMSRESVFTIKVYSVEIPFSFDQLDNTINTLGVSATNPQNETKLGTITFETGTYDIKTLLIAFKNLLTQFCETSAPGYTGFTPIFSFTYNDSTGLTVYYTENAKIVIDFINNPSLGEMFGFRDMNLNIDPMIPVGSNVLCITSPVSYLLLRASNLRQFKSSEFVVESNVYSDIICKLNLTTGRNTWNYIQPNTPPVMIMNDSIDHINFYITNNRSFTPIYLKGVNYSFNFVISEVIMPKINHAEINPSISMIQPKREPVNFSQLDGMSALTEKEQEEQRMKSAQDDPEKLIEALQPISEDELYLKDRMRQTGTKDESLVDIIKEKYHLMKDLERYKKKRLDVASNKGVKTESSNESTETLRPPSHSG